MSLTVSDMPTEEARRPLPLPQKKARPFAAMDNPTLSPSYDDGLSPSPVPDWSLVREDPSDHPECSRSRLATASVGVVVAGVGAARVTRPTVAGRGATAGRGVPAVAMTASTARTTTGNSSVPAVAARTSLRGFDAFMIENHSPTNSSNSNHSSNGGGHCRDWLPDDSDRSPHEISPKKRRVDRVHYANVPVMNYEGVVDVDDGLDVDLPLPLDLDMDHDRFAHNNAHNNTHNSAHGMQPMHPELSMSYHHEEDLAEHHSPLPRVCVPPRPHPHLHPHPHSFPSHTRAHPYPHPHFHHPRFAVAMHPEDFMMQEMEIQPYQQHFENGGPDLSPRSPNSSQMSPMNQMNQMHVRRAPVPMVRHSSLPAAYARPRYMNAYVPNVPVQGQGQNPARRHSNSAPNSPHPRQGYHPQLYGRYRMNPANLPSPHVRKAFHLSPGTGAALEGARIRGPYFLSVSDEEPFGRQHSQFEGDIPVDTSQRERTSTSVAALDLHLQRSNSSRSRLPEVKRLSLPVMKHASPGCDAHSNGRAVHDEDKNFGPVQCEQEEEEEIAHFSLREHKSLSIDEDVNWLSEFQSFVRKEFMEIFRANSEDVKFRNTSRKVIYRQLGIRCRFCAHLNPSSRARRSSAYPSSTAQIYQSFNMMIRDHFPRCEAVPSEKMELFQRLKAKNNQGAADSKLFWIYASEKLGLVDSESGIYMDEATELASRSMPPFSTTSRILAESRHPPVLLMMEDDRSLISQFLFEVLSRVQRVHLLDCELRSTRKNLKVGLPGFGCRYCCEAGRLGFCRIFPTKRKGLPEKVSDMYEHLRRCTLCPAQVKERLECIRPDPEVGSSSTEKAFFDRLWLRLNGGISR